MEKAIEMASWFVFKATQRWEALKAWCDASEQRQVGAAIALMSSLALFVTFLSALPYYV